MPAYDYMCKEGHRFEEIHSVHACDEDHYCPICDGLSWRVPQATPTVGPMPSKPVRIGGAGVEVTSNAELRAYQEANPNDRVMSRDSRWFQNHLDKARDGAERMAKKMGFRDLDQKRSMDIEARKKGRPRAEAPD